MSEQESISERELASYLTDEVFGSGPRSPSEAVAEAEEREPVAPDVEEPPVEEPPIRVPDERTEPQEEPAKPAVEAPVAAAEETPEEEPEESEEPADQWSAWATKKYGADPTKWAKAAFDQEQYISKIGTGAREWQEYATALEQQIQQIQTQQTQSMPMSSAEEEWVEQSLSNPLEYARQAAYSGNANLYNAVVGRVAEENAMLAANIGTQIQMEMQQAAQQAAYEQNGAQQQPPLQESLGASFARLGLDLERLGPSMMEKVGELGEYNPYVQAMLYGDDIQRDLGVSAVADLVRAGNLTQTQVRDEQRASQIKREGELRREAAGVVTGSPHTPPPTEDPLMAGMMEEWKARRQWGGE